MGLVLELVLVMGLLMLPGVIVVLVFGGCVGVSARNKEK